MKTIYHAVVVAVSLATPLSLGAQDDAGSPLPAVETVLQRVVEQTDRENDNDRAFNARYSYTRCKVTEYRDSKGDLKKREEKKGVNIPPVASVAYRSQPADVKPEANP